MWVCYQTRPDPAFLAGLPLQDCAGPYLRREWMGRSCCWQRAHFISLHNSPRTGRSLKMGAAAHMSSNKKQTVKQEWIPKKEKKKKSTRGKWCGLSGVWKLRLRSQTSWVQIWALPCGSCVTQGKSLHLSVPWVFNLQNWEISRNRLPRLLWGLNELMWKRYINVSCHDNEDGVWKSSLFKQA